MVIVFLNVVFPHFPLHQAVSDIPFLCTECPKKNKDLCSELFLVGKMASYKKFEENRPHLKFNSTYKKVFSEQFEDCRKGL